MLSGGVRFRAAAALVAAFLFAISDWSDARADSAAVNKELTELLTAIRAGDFEASDVREKVQELQDELARREVIPATPDTIKQDLDNLVLVLDRPDVRNVFENCALREALERIGLRVETILTGVAPQDVEGESEGQACGEADGDPEAQREALEDEAIPSLHIDLAAHVLSKLEAYLGDNLERQSRIWGNVQDLNRLHEIARLADEFLNPGAFSQLRGFEENRQSSNRAERPTLTLFREYLARLTATLNGELTDEQREALAAALKNEDLPPGSTTSTEFDYLKAFNDAIDKLVEPLRIHVVRAWYGHVESNWRDGMQCNATNAMRTLCEGNPHCNPPATPADGPLNPIALCGFDPAPFARGRVRGLVVQYACERGGQEHWDNLATNPLVEPYNIARLQSGAMSIRCPSPAPAGDP